MRPEEILDTQGGLIERLEGRDNLGRMLIAVFGSRIKHLTEREQAAPEMLDIDTRSDSPEVFESLSRGQTLGTLEMARQMMHDSEGAANVYVLGNAVKASYAYRVTHDMCMLLEHAAATLDESDKVDLDLPPTGCGFVRFDRPIPVADIRGFSALINWMIWGRVSTPKGETAIGVWTFNDAWTHPDGVWQSLLDEEPEPGSAEVLRRVMWRFMPVSFDFMVPDASMGPMEQLPNAAQLAELNDEGLTPYPGTNIRRFAHALWLLLNQTIVTSVDEPLDRPARRRAGRRGLPPKVVTIKLRRSANTNRHEGESHVEWSHRWIVRGHWRWQACGVGRTERRRIWIAPFVKGPEDAPLVQSEKLYDLSR